MSHNLTLGRKQKSDKKGEKPTWVDFPVRQTPTTLTRECESFLSEKWKVFDRYANWCRMVAFPGFDGKVGSCLYNQAEAELNEHLDSVRKALDEGYEWSWI